MKIHRIDHAGVVVNDLEAAKAFFLNMGLEVQGVGEAEGTWMDQVIGIDGTKVSIAMLGTPDGEAKIELIKFHSSSAEIELQQAHVNTAGIRHLAFAVEDIDDIVSNMKDKGTECFSEVQTYEYTFKLCYVHGPEGIILELTEQIN